MSFRKYIFIIFGADSQRIGDAFARLVGHDDIIYDESNVLIYENRIYDTGLPSVPITFANVTLHFHGIVFPKSISIDALADNRESVIKGMINDHTDDPKKIPDSIVNGSYVGIAIDHKKNTAYAFTSFLNSIPFYYAKLDNAVVLSTDLEYLAKTLDSHLSLSNGLFEYYANGTNLSEQTAFPNIKCIPKGGVLEYCRGELKVDFHYKMPTEISQGGFNQHVEQFADLWDKTLRSLHSKRFKHGLGFTGGLDSRLILAALPKRSLPLLYTGSHPDHPDVLLAKHITGLLGLSNHVMEDYRESDKVHGYAKYTAISENPFHCNSLYFIDQMNFRKDHELVYEYTGLTEFLGGVYHYSDRRSIGNAFKMSLPPVEHEMKLDSTNILRLLALGLRNNNLSEDLLHFPGPIYKDLQSSQIGTFWDLFKQIGQVTTEEAFLERFRHIHKMANLLTWAVLPGRRYNEHLSPSMNIEMTDFACRIPLTHRDSRRLLLAYIQKYKPELAGFVISGYMFSANSPWFLYKLLAPHIKVLNHLGIRIPHFQWYLKKHDYKTISSDPRIYRLQREVCRNSDIIMNTEFARILETHRDDKVRLMRLYNIALLEKKMSMDEDELYGYLCGMIERID